MAEGGAGEGGSDAGGQGGGGGSGGAGDQGGKPGAGGTGGSSSDAGKTFTQEELDRHINERLGRERAKYAGFDDIKRKAEEFDKLQEEQKSELDKAIGKARKEGADEARSETNKTWETRVIRSEVRVAAAGKLADPEDAVRFLDLSAFKVDDEGNVDAKALVAAIDELVKSKPYLAANGTRQTRDFDAGARGSANGSRSMNDLIRGVRGN